VGHDLPVAGLSGIAVVMFHTMPFWSTPRPPVVRLPLAEFRAVNAPAGKRMTISRLSLPRVFAPCTLAGASVVGATGPPNPIVPTGMSCALFLEPLGLPIIALPRGYLRLGLFARLVKYSILTDSVKLASKGGHDKNVSL